MNAESKNNILIVIAGPTAVGKSKLSILLAKKLNCEIISADSMQVYKHMNIGTAKITPEEMSGIKHYLIDEFEPNEDFNVVKFQQLAQKYIADIRGKNKIPIIVGGTGFYIQSVVNDIDFTENDNDSTYRQELQIYVNKNGPEKLHKMLEEIDLEAANQIHENNIKRVIRALEYYKQTGNKISEHNIEQHDKKSPYKLFYYVLNRNRTDLYNTINFRVDEMIKNGLPDEVKSLLDNGCNKNMISMQGIGYKQLIDFFEGNSSYEEAVENIKQETRHFAKRQLTWFKRESQVRWINIDQFKNYDDICDYIIRDIEKED